MTPEGQVLDQKSLRYVLGRHEESDGLACDCVGFANATGGVILLGFKDVETTLPGNQRAPHNLPDRLAARGTVYLWTR